MIQPAPHRPHLFCQGVFIDDLEFDRETSFALPVSLRLRFGHRTKIIIAKGVAAHFNLPQEHDLLLLNAVVDI
jgi:hypothetical protein